MMDYMQKYNSVIIRLMYAMHPYFKNLTDIDEDEVINTACDSLTRYYNKSEVKNKPKRPEPFEMIIRKMP
jgi:hypothetical protein